MSRQRLEPGEIGRITIEEIPNPDGGKPTYRARGRARTHYGAMVQTEARGPSRTAAETKLRRRLKERINEGGGDVLTADSPVSMLMEAWWKSDVERRVWNGKGERRGTILRGTADMYRVDVDRIIKGIGDLTIREVRTVTLDQWIDSEAAGLVSIARGLTQHLTSAFGWAVRKGITEVNPARELDAPTRNKPKARALTVDELNELRELIDDYEQAAPGRNGGQPRVPYLRDIFELQLALGCRIGEVLALRWQDVDLAATPPTATICGTIKRRKGKKADGGGLYRQTFPKSDAGIRTVTLPQFAVERLMRLRVEATGNSELVFHVRGGGPRDFANVRTRLRKVRGEKYDWVTPHSLRRTMGTLIAREYGLEAAAIQLGHSETRVTESAYVERSHVAPDLSAATQRMFGGEA